MTNISVSNRKIFKKRRDGQIAPGGGGTTSILQTTPPDLSGFATDAELENYYTSLEVDAKFALKNHAHSEYLPISGGTTTGDIIISNGAGYTTLLDDNAIVFDRSDGGSYVWVQSPSGYMVLGVSDQVTASDANILLTADQNTRINKSLDIVQDLTIKDFHYYSKEITRYGAADSVILLCEWSNGNNEVLGKIYGQRSSGYFGYVNFDIRYSSASATADYNAYMEYDFGGNTQINDAGLFHVTYQGIDYVALRVQAVHEYWASELFFNGYLRSDGVNVLLSLSTTDVTVIEELNYASAKYFKTGSVNMLDRRDLVFGDSEKASKIWSDGTYLAISQADYSTGPLNLYVTKSIPVTYLYSDRTYLGESGGSSQALLRGNLLAGDDWSIRANEGAKVDKISSYSTPYVEGSEGQGYTLVKNADGKYKLEIDNIDVRNTLFANEFVKEKTRVTNGNWHVTQSAQAIPLTGQTSAGLFFQSVGATNRYNYYFNSNIESNGLLAGDIIRTEKTHGNGKYRYDWVVVDSQEDTIWVENSHQNRNDGQGNNELDSEDLHEIVNVDASYFFVNQKGYEIETSFNRQNWKTSPFTINGRGNIYFAVRYSDGGSYPNSNIIFQVFDGNDNPISSFYYMDVVSEEGFDGKIEIIEAPENNNNCYIKFYNDSYVYVMYFQVYKLEDATIYDGENIDITGAVFARMGHISDDSRQGSVMATPDHPSVKVIDGVNSSTINNYNIKAQMGDLEGLTFGPTGKQLSGYGLYSSNAYISGQIESKEGTIGGLTIKDSTLQSNGPTGKVVIDGEQNNVKLFDDNNLLRVNLTTQPQSELSNLAGTGFAFGSVNAADVSTGSVANRSSWQDDTYYEQLTAGSNADLQNFTTLQTGNRLDITANNEYVIDFSLKITPSYTLTPNDNVKTDGVTSEHFFAGFTNYTVYARLVDSNNNAVISKTITGKMLVDENGEFNIDVFQGENTGLITTGEVYMKVSYTITNLQQEKTITTYWKQEWGQWVLDRQETTYSPLSIDNYLVEVTQFNLNAINQITEVSSTGFLSYWDNDQYIQVDGSAGNTKADPFIKSSGAWKHDGLFEHNLSVTNRTSNYIVEDNDQVITNLGHTGNLYCYISATFPVGKVLTFVNTLSGQAIFIRSADSAQNVYVDGTQIYITTTTTSLSVGSYSSMRIIKIDTNKWAAI